MNSPFKNWEQYYLTIAFLVALKSKDASSKIGAVIVSEDNSIISTGYNGLPKGVNDDVPSRHERPEKYEWFEHAERNSIYLAAFNGVRLKNATMYTNGTPCSGCGGAIIQSGIKKVVVSKKWDKGNAKKWNDSSIMSIEKFKESGIELVQSEMDIVKEIFMFQNGKIV